MNHKPCIILISPQMGENIGSAARVMMNFGLSDLRIVTPRDGWPNPKAVDTAKWAKPVIEAAQVFDSLKDATFDISKLYATTARSRDMVKPVATARQTAQEILSHKGKSAIMFGAERTGLENKDISLADKITVIPVSKEYSSLNLAQAVSIICYEYFHNIYEESDNIDDDLPICSDLPGFSESNKLKEIDLGKSNAATKHDVAKMFEHLEKELDEGDFFKVPDKRAKMIINIRNIFARANLTDQDVRTLRGIIKSLTRKK